MLDCSYMCFPMWRRLGQKCFKCHIPGAKQISLFSAATWRKQNIKSGLKVMYMVLLTFLSVGWQRLSLSFSADYTCTTSVTLRFVYGWKLTWKYFLWVHWQIRKKDDIPLTHISQGKLQVATDISFTFWIFAVKFVSKIFSSKRKKVKLLPVWFCFEKGIAVHRDKILPSGQVVIIVRSG